MRLVQEPLLRFCAGLRCGYNTALCAPGQASRQFSRCPPHCMQFQWQSTDWQTQNRCTVFEQVDQWGFEINVCNMPDLDSFLQAVLLTPRSITSDFNFPKWHYYGRGAGGNSCHYEYQEKWA